MSDILTPVEGTRVDIRKEGGSRGTVPSLPVTARELEWGGGADRGGARSRNRPASWGGVYGEFDGKNVVGRPSEVEKWGLLKASN